MRITIQSDMEAEKWVLSADGKDRLIDGLPFAISDAMVSAIKAFCCIESCQSVTIVKGEGKKQLEITVSTGE